MENKELMELLEKEKDPDELKALLARRGIEPPEVVELSPDDLNGVAGGVVTNMAADMVMLVTLILRDNGKTKEEAKDEIRECSPNGIYGATLDEILELVDIYWEIMPHK